MRCLSTLSTGHGGGESQRGPARVSSATAASAKSNCCPQPKYLREILLQQARDGINKVNLMVNESRQEESLGPWRVQLPSWLQPTAP